MILLYARTHRMGTYLFGLAFLVAITFALATTDVGIINRNYTVVTPIGRLLPLGYGVLAASTLEPVHRDYEAVATRRLEMMRCWHVPLVVLSSAIAAGLVSSGVTGSWSEAIISMRATLIWSGIALLCGGVLRPLVSWALPLIVAAYVAYDGYGVDGGPRWWNFTAQAPGDAVTWMAAVVTLIAGGLAIGVNRWTVHRILTAITVGTRKWLHVIPRRIRSAPAGRPRRGKMDR